MKDQIVEITGQYPSLPGINERVAAVSYPDASFWLQIYPPLSGDETRVWHSRLMCPWGMAAELDDSATPAARRRSLLEALKNGLKTIRQYGLPANRIRFAEDRRTRSIMVCVD